MRGKEHRSTLSCLNLDLLWLLGFWFKAGAPGHIHILTQASSACSLAMLEATLKQTDSFSVVALMLQATWRMRGKAGEICVWHHRGTSFPFNIMSDILVLLKRIFYHILMFDSKPWPFPNRNEVVFVPKSNHFNPNHGNDWLNTCKQKHSSILKQYSVV